MFTDNIASILLSQVEEVLITRNPTGLVYRINTDDFDIIAPILTLLLDAGLGPVTVDAEEENRVLTVGTATVRFEPFRYCLTAMGLAEREAAREAAALE